MYVKKSIIYIGVCLLCFFLGFWYNASRNDKQINELTATTESIKNRNTELIRINRELTKINTEFENNLLEELEIVGTAEQQVETIGITLNSAEERIEIIIKETGNLIKELQQNENFQ